MTSTECRRTISPAPSCAFAVAAFHDNGAKTDAAWLDLYHRTTTATAERIAREKSMTSLENTGEAFFSTHPDGDSTASYGEYESHYAIRVDRLMPEHFVAD